MRPIFWVVVGVLLTGCALGTVDKEQCRRGEWEKIGYVDGRDGALQNHKTEHKKSCAVLDDASYDLGWEKGRAEYCTPENWHHLGEQGRHYSPICPSENEKSLKEMYVRGFALFHKRAELRDVEKKIHDEKERREKDQSVVNHISQAYHLLAGTSPTQRMEDQAAKLQDEVNRMEIGAPSRIATPAHDNFVRDGYSTLGAVVGSFLGFGSGHAIQGRYKTDGWKWTVGEVAAFGAMAAISRSECPTNERPAGDVNTEPARCSSSWPTVAVLGWLGFRIWQGVDLFSHSSRSRYSAAVRPTYMLAVSPGGLSLLYGF